MSWQPGKTFFSSLLGFIHEDSSQAFVLDIADLFRGEITLRIAFGAVKEVQSSQKTLEQLVRRHAAVAFAKADAIPGMIDRIKMLMEAPP
jgi:CRISPR-associated protein Cas1